MNNEYIKLFTDSNIIINGLKVLLEKEQIHYIIKDRFESARLGGFGEQSTSVEIHVLENDLEKAEDILATYEKEINS